MIINDLDGYYIVFDTKNWNTELDTLIVFCAKARKQTELKVSAMLARFSCWYITMFVL